MFTFNSLSTKIISMALLLALIPLIIVYFVASALFTNVLIENIQDNLTAQAIQAGDSIDQFFHQRITDIKMLSQADLLEEDDTDKINRYLEEIQVENNLLSDLYVLAPSGEFIAIAKNKLKIGKRIQALMPQMSELFTKVLASGQGDVIVSEATRSNEGLQVILMTPITDDSNTKAIKILMIALDLKVIEKIVANFERNLIGNKSVYIVDNEGLVIATPDKDSELLKPFKDLKVNPDLLESLSNQGEDGSAIYTDVMYDEVVAGFADMDEFGINHALDWSIIGLAPIAEVAAPVYSLRYFLIFVLLLLTAITAVAAVLVGRSISSPILKLVESVTQISDGNLDRKIDIIDQGEIGQLCASISKMQDNIREMPRRLEEMRVEQAEQNWLKTGLNEFNEKISGEQDLANLGENVINFLTPYLNAQVGAFYLFIESEAADKTDDCAACYLQMIASHAYIWRKHTNNKINLTEGLVGQAAYERKPIILTDVNADYLQIGSGLGETAANSIFVMPFLYENHLKGVIELASIKTFTKLHLDFLLQAMPALGIVINTAQSREKMRVLLDNSQQQARELADKSQQMLTQQKELQLANEELQAQSEELQCQQEELRQANEQLELRTQDLQQQKDEIRQKNEVLQTTQATIERKAHELEVSNRYKSEFLANMSHELRTPLNAIMIISQLLAENEDGNLTEEQIDYGQTIYNAGADLLDLINEVLDLSKVEAGKVEITPEEFSLSELLLKSIDSKFQLLATQKSITFAIELSPDVPDTIYSGVLRVKQVLNNLLSNAFKFTHEGGVTLSVDYQPTAYFDNDEPYLIIKITDTGIGIPADKQQVIFEAFQQADGSTSRKYGGTGLGLSISRQLARLLGGDITVDSTEHQGSVFTFYLPTTLPDTPAMTASAKAIINHPKVNSESEVQADKPILIISDNSKWVEQFNSCLSHCQALTLRIITHQDDALAHLKQHACDCIIVDVESITLDEFTLFAHLAQDPQLATIPIIVYSTTGLSSAVQSALASPALKIEFIDSFERLAEQAETCFETLNTLDIQQVKNRQTILVDKKVLLVDDDVRNTYALSAVLKHKKMHTYIAHDGVQGLQALEEHPDIDIVLMDIMMPEMDGYEAMRQIRSMHKFKKLPVIALTAKAMKDDKQKCIDAGASDYLTKPVDVERLVSVMQVWLYQ